MSANTIFMVIIRVLGLYLVFTTIFYSLPSVVIGVFWSYDTYAAIWNGITIVFTISVAWLMISRAKQIVTYLRLTKDLDQEQISLEKLDAVTIVSTSILVMGGFMIVNNFPRALVNFWQVMKWAIDSSLDPPREVDRVAILNALIVGVITILLGYLLVVNYSWLGRRIVKADKNE